MATEENKKKYGEGSMVGSAPAGHGFFGSKENDAAVASFAKEAVSAPPHEAAMYGPEGPPPAGPMIEKTPGGYPHVGLSTPQAAAASGPAFTNASTYGPESGGAAVANLQGTPMQQRGASGSWGPQSATAPVQGPVQQAAPAQAAIQQQPQGIVTRYTGDGTKTLAQAQGNGGTGQLTTAAANPTGTAIRPNQQAMQSMAGSPSQDQSNYDKRQAFLDQSLPVPQGARQISSGSGGGVAPPQFLTAESGVGWKSRAVINKALAENYQTQLNNQGAGERAEMQDATTRQGQQLQNQTAQENLAQQAPLHAAETSVKTQQAAKGKNEASLAQALLGLTPGTPEYAAAERKYAAVAHGKTGEQRTPNIQMLEEVDPSDPQGLRTRKVPIHVNQDGTGFNRVTEGGAQQAPVQKAPPAALDYLKQNPNTANMFKQKYGYLPQGY